ncbi:hypothetical protein L1987_22204 [Smallanthus sonchifolius]|uniref:Uncharacterized protein n=1 Tax=Smallanthus sonchifolius TaxID=185202 RepID=A0ACB9IFP5_9ASTR|nr:hypothetical protein L1987_22204 [Smallanthus sonchifolius]
MSLPQPFKYKRFKAPISFWLPSRFPLYHLLFHRLLSSATKSSPKASFFRSILLHNTSGERVVRKWSDRMFFFQSLLLNTTIRERDSSLPIVIFQPDNRLPQDLKPTSALLRYSSVV